MPLFPAESLAVTAMTLRLCPSRTFSVHDIVGGGYQ